MVPPLGGGGILGSALVAGSAAAMRASLVSSTGASAETYQTSVAFRVP